MKILSLFQQRAAARCVRPRFSRTILCVERLEERVVLDGNVTGPAALPEGSLYSLQLQVGNTPVKEWEIDWGDGNIDTLPGTATTATHDYGNGPANFTISVTATHHVTFPLFQWGTENGGNGHYYALTSTAKNWLNSESEAVTLGGHLVSITSAAEQAFVVSTFLSGSNQQKIYWTGLSDHQTEGVYRWTDGEAVSYTNWQPPNEPNNYGGDEDYVTINWHKGNNRTNAILGSWNDAPLNGINSALTAPEPYRGIAEFITLPSGEVTTHTLQVQIDNLDPTLQVLAPDTVFPRSVIQVHATASDPFSGDQQEGFTYSIDWQSDGVVDETVTGADAIFSRRFKIPGVFQVTVTASDRDGGMDTYTQWITVLSAEQQVTGIKSEVQGLIDSGVLDKKQAKGLLQKLDQADKHLSRNKLKPALATLKAAKKEIRAMAQAGHLPKEDAANLMELLDHAMAAARL